MAIKVYLKQYLEYVRNAGGNATVASFDDDFEPIGPTLRSEIMPFYVIEKNGKLALTEDGAAELSAAR